MTLISSLMEIIGTPNDFTGYVILYTIGGICFGMIMAVTLQWLFRFGRR